MSREGIRGFREQVDASAELLKAVQDAQHYTEVIELARKHGHDITPQELHQAFLAHQGDQHRELSDAELALAGADGGVVDPCSDPSYAINPKNRCTNA